jgi:hypothetical protein
MGGAGFLAVKNFERFQHYKNRNPPWIKFYASILFDYEFQSLPDKSKSHLMLIWLLVSQRHDHRIPNDPRWVAQRIGATEKVDLQILVDGGWLILLADCYQPSVNGASKALEQSRGETEEKRIEDQSKKTDLGDEGISVQELFESWNNLCPPLGLSAVRELSPTRKQKAGLRIREHPKVTFWEDVFARIKGSAFLLGRGPKNGKEPWRMDFDWLIDNDTNCIKVAEGRYGNR